MDMISPTTTDGSSTAASTSTTVPNSNAQEQGHTSTSANGLSMHTTTTHGRTAHRSPSTSSYTSTASAASSKKTRSLRPPTWRAGSMRVGKTTSATQLKTSSSGSFETSPRAKPVTSASEPSVSLVNAESFPSFNSDEVLDINEAYRTARPRERRGRMDSSASVASLSMHITNSPKTVEGKGKGKMTYGHTVGRERGDGGRKLMELFEEQDLQVTDSLSSDPLTASTSAGSRKSNGSAASDAPTMTDTGTGPMNGGEPVHAAVFPPSTSTAASPLDPAVISPTNDESNASTATIITSDRLEPIDLSKPNYSSTSTNQLEAYSDSYPTTSSDLTPTNDNSSNANALATLSPTLSTSPTNTATTSVNDAPLPSSSSQLQIPNEPDQTLTTPADTSTGETVSSSTSWFGSLGRAMGRTQADPSESTKEQSETERRVRVVHDHLKDAYSTSVSESNSGHHSSTATQSTQSVDPGTETVVIRTRTRGSGDLQSAKTRPKTWFFSQSPTPSETETTTISGSTTNVAGNGNKDAVSALIASTSRSQSPSKTPDGRTSPPSASTAGSSSFPSSPLMSSSIPSSIDDEVPIPRLMLSKVTVSPQELEEMNQMIGGAEDGLSLGLSTIKPRALQRLGVVSMHSQMGLEDQALVGTIKGRSSSLIGLASGNVDGSEGEDNSRNEHASAEEAPVPVGSEVEVGKDSDNVSPNSTPRPSPRPPRQRINSMNSLNPSTSRFSIVGVPLSFWRAPSPNSARSEEENKKSMEPKSHADTKPIPSTSNATSSATSTTTATSAVNASINTTPNTAISTPHSRSKSPSPLPSTLSSKSGPVTSLSTDTITAAASTNDALDAKDELTRTGNVSVNEEPVHAESSEEERMAEGRKAEEETTGTTTPKDPVPTDTTTNDSTTKTATQQQQNTTYTGSWWDYVGWGGSSGMSQNEAQSTLEAAKGNVSESPVEAVEQDSQGIDNSHEPPAQPVSELEVSIPSTVPDTITPSDAASEPAPAQSQLEPSPPDPDVSSTTGMKSAPPTVLAEESQPPRPASVFSGETVRSGAGSWLAPWTWYGGSGSTSAPPTAAVPSTSIDKASKLKRQMTESEKVKEEALAREREREADAELEKDSKQQDQNATNDIQTSDQLMTATAVADEDTALTLPEGEQSASSPPAANEPTQTSSTSISSAPSGWASFFSIGKGKETSIKQLQDGNDVQDDNEVKRDENGMEIMDLDEDDEAAPPSQPVDVPGKADSSITVQSKEVVKKESIREILKAGATSPERKVTLVKALLQSSSPRPASILSSLSSSPTKTGQPTPDSPTKASAKSDQGKLLTNVPRDQIAIKSRGRTDSIITTATSASNASSVAKRAPLLVVSDDVKAKAATNSVRSSSRGGNEKEKDGSASGTEVSEGKEKSEKAKTKVEKKASKDPVKDKDKKHVKSKSNSGSSTPVPPAPPNLVLPTWSDTFYTSPRSHLPSGVLPLTPLPGTEAYEVMSAKDEQKSLGSTIGRTMKFVSGVLFSGDRSTGHSERRRTPSLFGGSTIPASSAASRRGSESSAPALDAGKRSASPLMSGGLVSPRIAALRAGSSKGKVGGSVKLGSTESQTLKQKEAMVDVEHMKQKEKLYWDWGRGLPRSWEVVQFGHPIGLEKDDTEGLLEGGEDLKPEKAKAEQIDGRVSEPAKVLIPGMGLEPGTTLSLPTNILEGYKNKGKGKVPSEASAVDDVLKGCRKVVVIGIHGWFPGAVMRSVLGEPTGTSPKFVNMMVQALEEFQERHGVRLERITKIPLEGEGTIDKRVEKLYTNLLSNQEWMDDLHNADAIFVATHSQGSVVSTHLLDRLIRERHIRTSKNGASEPITDIGVNMIPLPPQRVCCLALCGIHLGPLRYLSTSSLLQPYIQYFESAAARELFEFQNTENDVSKFYVNALRNVVDNGTKMVYVASLNDQVVPIYSGLFTSVSHPLILRALYIDGDAYNSSDFLSNLLVLLLRVLNTGLSDSGLLAHLSEVTAGSLNGVGHSTAYEELATFSLAVDYLFLTNDGFEEHPELTLDPFNAASEMNDYEIPWALRDLIADDRVAHFFSREITDLRNAFRDWNPKTSILRDIKRKLQPIQRLPSTLAPGSANSTSKL